jgi:galactose mutarotase-like enzyme
MPLHGFAQNTVWRLASSEASEETGATVLLEATPTDAPANNQEWFPFQWKLEMELRVTGSDLTIMFTVLNLDDKVMPFSIGTHPSFRLPFVPGTDISDSGLSWGSHTVDLALTPFSCLSGERKDHTEDGSLPASTFCDNVLGSKVAEGLAYMDLVSPKEGIGVRVSQKKVGESAEEKSPLYFVNWADAKQGFFCLEPWCGGPNSLNDGSAVELEPNKKFLWQHSIEMLSFDKAE